MTTRVIRHGNGDAKAIIADSEVGRSAEELAQHIEKFSEVAEELKSSRLKRSAVVLLLHDMTRIAKRDINLLLDAMPELKKEFLKA